MVQQIAGNKVLVEHATGQHVVLFRPPYGAHTPAIDREVKELGMLEVLWNVDSSDSLGPTTQVSNATCSPGCTRARSS